MGNLCGTRNPMVNSHPILNHSQTNIHSESELIFSPGLFARENEGSFYSQYEVEPKSLGAGRNGDVRKCIHKKSKDERVVKIIAKSRLLKEEIETRAVFKEVEILKTVDHPNLPRIYEFFEDSDNFYIILEFCKGGDLFDKIVEMQEFSEDQAAWIMHQILSGLTYLHGMKIIHRDIKPENILLDDKSGLHLKIIDFDTATFFCSSGYHRGIYGTALYMAPEIIKGRHTEKCDLWSCGIILYILFCGRPPYDGTDDEIFELLKHPKIDMDKACAHISPAGRDLLGKLLEPDPKKRISAKDACQHNWIKDYVQTSVSSNEVAKVLVNIKEFRRISKIREAIHTFIISKIMDPKTFQLEESVFNLMDSNCDGVLTKREIMGILQKEMPIEEAEMYCDVIMENADSDKNGYLDYTEFLRATIHTSKICTKENLLQAFKYFDENGNGVIEVNELRTALTDGAHITEDLVMEIMKEADKNHDGQIDLNEFEDLLVGAVEKDIID